MSATRALAELLQRQAVAVAMTSAHAALAAAAVAGLSAHLGTASQLITGMPTLGCQGRRLSMCLD